MGRGGRSIYDAFRRQLEDPQDGGPSEDEGERVLGLDKRGSKDETGASGGENAEEDGEDAQSDGEVGIGLSFMGALGGEDDEDDAKPTEKRDGNGGDSGEGHVGVGANGNACRRVSGENRGTTPMAWTRYTPPSEPHLSVSMFSTDIAEMGKKRKMNAEMRRKTKDDGAYWDDIYDDHRYSRYSLASKRVSAASTASGASKTSSRARANAPPMPVPPDWRSVDTPRPSIGSDGTNGYPMPFTRPSLRWRSASDESTHKLPGARSCAGRIATGDHSRWVGGDNHGEREQRVLHASTEDETGLFDGCTGVDIAVVVTEAVQSSTDHNSACTNHGRGLHPRMTPRWSLWPKVSAISENCCQVR